MPPPEGPKALNPVMWTNLVIICSQIQSLFHGALAVEISYQDISAFIISLAMALVSSDV